MGVAARPALAAARGAGDQGYTRRGGLRRPSGDWPLADMEQEAFLRQFVKRDCPVIPVILPDCEGDLDLPAFLEGMTRVDFRRDDPDPLEQLIWGITGQKRSVDVKNKNPALRCFVLPMSATSGLSTLYSSASDGARPERQCGEEGSQASAVALR